MKLKRKVLGLTRQQWWLLTAIEAIIGIFVRTWWQGVLWVVTFGVTMWMDWKEYKETGEWPKLWWQ